MRYDNEFGRIHDRSKASSFNNVQRCIATQALVAIVFEWGFSSPIRLIRHICSGILFSKCSSLILIKRFPLCWVDFWSIDFRERRFIRV